MKENFENDIERCCKVLKNGGIILYPTDTIWGIGCDATNESAVQKIFALKKRPDKKSMIILVAHAKEISGLRAFSNKKINAYLSAAEKPTTVIYEMAKNAASNLINEDVTIAIRIVQDDFCKALITRFKKAIVSTSANISGESFPKNFKEISIEIKNGVDYVVQHRKDDLICSKPSAIIKLTKEGEIEIIRS